MKFVFAVVMLALAVGVHSSILPWQLAQVSPGVSYVTSYNPGLLGLGPLASPLWGGIPGISLSQGPGGLAGPIAAPYLASPYLAAPLAAPLALPKGGGLYVAKTRGAIHTAPLEGHINSATSLNLAPAPGTL